MVAHPKELGGLGIIDLQRFGIALLLRWDWIRKTDNSRTWVDLPSSTDKATSALFRAATASIVGGGSSTLFWQDSWIHGQCVERIAPAVFAVVPRARARSRTVALGLADHAWVANISGARTVQVFLQYLDLWERVCAVHISPSVL
jgi:hypothetical protein